MNKINKLAIAVVLVVAGIMTGGMAEAQTPLKPKPQMEGCEENGCNNRPDAPKTRALKPKPVKECEENTCANRPDAPKTRALKPTKKKEECETICN